MEIFSSPVCDRPIHPHVGRKFTVSFPILYIKQSLSSKVFSYRAFAIEIMGKQLHCVVLFLFFALNRAGDGGVYTLDYLLDEAGRHSYRLQSITRQIEQAELSLQLIYSSWLPRISFGIEFDHSFARFIPYRRSDVFLEGG